MAKTFDCVEMKREGARRLREKLAGMSTEEERAFWDEGDRELREWQAQLRERSQRTGAATQAPASKV